MLELEENKRFLTDLQNNLQEMRESMKIDSLSAELKKLQEESSQENFWQDTEKSAKVFSKIKSLEKKIKSYTNLEQELNNLLEMNLLLETDFDEELLNDLLTASKSLEVKLDKLKIETYFSGKYDANNAILTLHPGAGRNRISGLGSNAL